MKKFSRARGIVALVVFLSVIVGLVVHTGTGTPSALGWRDIALICPVGALEALAGAKAFLVHPIVLLIAVLLIAFLIGKAFCAWVCPVPHIRDFFTPRKKKKGNEGSEGKSDEDAIIVLEKDDGKTTPSASGVAPDDDTPEGETAHGALPPIGGERDGVRIDSRHAVLVGAVASSFAFGFPVFCLICPVGLSFAVVIGLWNLFRFNEASWGLIIFPIIILVEVVFFRKWCTKFCPISAILSLVASHSKILRPVVDTHTCLRDKGIDCKTCVSVCPEKVDPHNGVIPECSRCGECVAQCPAKAITIPLIEKRKGEGKVIVE